LRIERASLTRRMRRCLSWRPVVASSSFATMPSAASKAGATVRHSLCSAARVAVRLSPMHARRSTLLYLVVLGLLTLPVARTESATLYVRIDARMLVERSDAIVLGRVQATSARWQNGRIVTEAVVDVETTVKGSPARELRVVQPGGRVGSLVMRVL